MRLVDLDPVWVIPGKVFMFRSPAGHGDWLLCKNVKMSVHEQIEMVAKFTGQDDAFSHRDRPCVPMNAETCWNIQGDDFATMTVTPSIDASASGNWHGFITGGNIVGGI